MMTGSVAEEQHNFFFCLKCCILLLDQLAGRSHGLSIKLKIKIGQINSNQAVHVIFMLCFLYYRSLKSTAPKEDRAETSAKKPKLDSPNSYRDNELSPNPRTVQAEIMKLRREVRALKNCKTSI